MKNKSASLQKSFYFGVVPLLFGVINALLSQLTKVIETPLFLDSIFTAAAALVMGLIPGVLTAVWTHFFMEFFNGFNGECFIWVIVSLGTVLSMRVIARYSDKRNIAVFLNAVLLTTLLNALLGSTISVFLFEARTGHPSDSFMTGFIMLGQNLFSSSFWGRIPINLIDKGIAVGGAFGFYYLDKKIRHQNRK